jgi:hypothetical protein
LSLDTHRRPACPRRPLRGGAGGVLHAFENPQSVAAIKQARKRKLTAAADAPVPREISEPEADWVPLGLAPFRYLSGRYIRSAEEWLKAVEAVVWGRAEALVKRLEKKWREVEAIEAEAENWRKFLPEDGGVFDASAEEAWKCYWRAHKAREAVETAERISAVQWSVIGDDWRALITAGEILTNVNAKTAHLLVSPIAKTTPFIGVDLTNDRVGAEAGWCSLANIDAPAADWHRGLASHFYFNLEVGLERAIASGAAHIMARKNSPLAPFDRVFSDQWHFFSLDKDKAGFSFAGAYSPNSATGPQGEKLYAIHVAPGEHSSDDPKRQCEEWLVQLMRQSLDRSPKPLEALAEDAVERYRGLSKRAFRKCLDAAQARTGNQRWSDPGAPKKSRHKKSRL